MLCGARAGVVWQLQVEDACYVGRESAAGVVVIHQNTIIIHDCVISSELLLVNPED